VRVRTRKGWGAALIELHDIEVSYGPTRALDRVDLAVAAGSVHALVGENGAGKSTLLRALVGLVRPRAGSAALVGRSRLPLSPAEAESWGIAFAPQEISLCDELSVADCATLGREPRRHGLLDRSRQHARARELLTRLGADIDVRARSGSLGASARKLVQIARALAADPAVLLLDEPTAALDRAGAAAVARIARAHAAAGGCVVLVSHQIDEVLALADVVSVLRDGRHVSTRPTPTLSADDVVRDMVGRALEVRPAAQTVALGEPALTWVEPRVEVRAGEIVGLAGLVGAGRSSLLERMAAAVPGSALLPEDRVRKGLVASLALRENLFLPARGRWLRSARERAAAREWIERLRIRASGPDAPVGTLSGGNQQKLLLARALARQPHVLLLDEPTQGVDIGAKREIHARIRAAAARGTGVLVASSDLPELLLLSDRIAVLRRGTIVGQLAGECATEERVIALASGVAA
jgi:ABC-type sugar transport system ATPase subunit